MDVYDSDPEEEEEEEEEEDEDQEGSEYNDEDYGFEYTGEGEDDPVSKASQANYVVLSEEDILHRQSEAIDDVAAVLSISKTEAGILLRHFKWSVSRVQDEWFQDEEKVRQLVGLPKGSEHRVMSNDAVTCGICFESYAHEDTRAPSCDEHFFCTDCWQGYIKSAIADGPGCLTLRCPDPKCGASVGQDMVLALVDDDSKRKYMRYLLRSYVEDNRKAKWCPAPGCDYAVEYVPGSHSFDIVCHCCHNFCWNCLEEAHRPVDCETVGKWILKNTAESENMNWILANSKPCPKCKRPIEKNQGCMHMSCTPPCKFEFCWLCLGAWSEHGERTGGFYACNRYETAKNEGAYDEAERRRDMAKNSLERYTHYYERWATNESSRVTALESLRSMQSKKIETLSDMQSQPVSQLKFVTDAWQQVVECRRVLKWTYAYGFYLPEQEHAKRAFFEYLQGEAEAGLERLHKTAEQDLEGFLTPPPVEMAPVTAQGQVQERPSMAFNEFRTKLAGLTSVTHTYFENLVRALENGLQDVDNSKILTRVPSGSSKGAAGKAGKAAKVSSSSRGITSRAAWGRSVPAEEPAFWSCDHCTLANPPQSRVCAVCNLPRGP